MSSRESRSAITHGLPMATELLGGIFSAEATVAACLRRIAERDKQIRAWTHIDEIGAFAAARRLDGIEGIRGALHGVPIGVKDMIDTGDMPTTYNSPLYGGFRPAADAACVETLRAAGAIILGKTDTTEFAAAGRDAATANPHDISRTPGGSSAGSAAAVADGHVPLALATQTGGSTIRPASFCGIYGLKPSWGLVSREGAKIYANSLDTVGWYARSIDDLELMCRVFGFADPPPVPADMPLRIALCRTPYWDDADSDARTAIGRVLEALRAQNAEITEIELPPLFDHLAEAHRIILMREGGAAFLNLHRARPTLLHDDFHARALNRAGYSDRQLRDAYDRTAEARVLFEALAAGHDAVLAPSATGVAPVGRGPGNPIFNQLWTLLHGPVVNMPFGRGSCGMPVGVSLVAPRFEDRRLLAAARRVASMLQRAGLEPTC